MPMYVQSFWFLTAAVQNRSVLISLQQNAVLTLPLTSFACLIFFTEVQNRAQLTPSIKFLFLN